MSIIEEIGIEWFTINIVWFIAWIIIIFISAFSPGIGFWKYPVFLGIAFSLPIFTLLGNNMSKREFEG